MRRWHPSIGRVICCVIVWSLIGPLANGQQYPTAKAAAAAGAKFIEARDYKSAQAPLEAALNMATDDAFRLKLYNNLMACYRLLPENEKMIEACEFTIAKTRSNAERSNTARSLTSFLFQRGKLEETRTVYINKLDKDADDIVTLSMLAEINKVNSKDREKAGQYQARLDIAEQKRSGKLAEEEENLASTEPAEATTHWKQAAVFWIEAAEPAKALKAAKQAEATGPEKRSPLTRYFWHAHLGDVYLSAGEPQDAIRHFELAMEATPVAGQKKSCEEKLVVAKAKLTEKK